MDTCLLCERPVPLGGDLLMCEIKTCASKPTRWFHDRDGVHWLVCRVHSTPYCEVTVTPKGRTARAQVKGPLSPEAQAALEQLIDAAYDRLASHNPSATETIDEQKEAPNA